MKLTVVLPCYNEEENIARIPEILVPELLKLGCNYEIILVDDGSKDRSFEVASSLNIPELRIMRHEKNKGIGAAIKTAIREATGDLMVTLDTDFTFHPKYIKDLIDRFKKGDIDFVIGSPRLASFGTGIQKYRVFISIAANMVYSALLGKKVTAVSPIFRLYKTSQLKELQIETDGFDISVEILFRLILTGRKFAEVPTPLGLRQFGVSKLNYKKEIFRHLFLVRKIVSWRTKQFFFKKHIIVFIKKYFFVIIVGIVIGSIYYMPNILIPFLLKQDGITEYHPLNIEAPILDEVGSYGVKIREIMDGNWRDGDPYIYEYKNRYGIWGNYYLSLFIGILLKYLGADNPTPLYTIGDFLFPMVSFVLVFYLLYQITSHLSWSLLGGTVVVVFPNVKSAFNALITTLHSHFSADTLFNIGNAAFNENLTRILVPAAALPFLFIFFITFFKLLEKQTWQRIVFFAATLGFLFYTYSYHLIFALFVVATSCAILFLGKKWKELLYLIGAIFAAIFIGVFGIHSLYAVMVDPDYTLLRGRLGLVITRNLDFSVDNIIFFAVVGLIFVIALQKKIVTAPIFIFTFSLLMATFEVLNLQIITGVNPQPDHWGSRVNIYVLVLALMLAIFYFFKLIGRIQFLKVVSVIALVFLLMSATLFQVTLSANSRHQYVSFPEIHRSFAWINQYVPPDSVIAASSGKMIVSLPFYTHANTYYSYINFTLAPDLEAQERFFETLRIFNVSDEFFSKATLMRLDPGREKGTMYLRGFEIDSFFTVYGEKYRSALDGGYFMEGGYPESAAQKLISDYNKQPRIQGKTLVTKYKADYLYYGPYERLLGQLNEERFKNLELVYNDNLVQIFKIK